MKTTYLAMCVLLCFLVAVPASGQYVSDPPPVDSPYWWTLSEALSPQELYDALQSRERNQERLRKAIREGHYDVIPESRIKELALYIDGRTAPELWPMFDTFAAFAARFSYRPDYHETARRELIERGMSEAGAAQVVAIADETWRREDELNTALQAQRMKFVDRVLAPAYRALGRKQVRGAMERGDFGQISVVTGMASSNLAQLHQAWSRDVSAEVAVRSIEDLRTLLSEEEWTILREFLREEVNPIRRVDLFSEEGLR